MQMDVPDEEKCREFFMKDIKEDSDNYLIYSAFNAINKIYVLEYSVDYSRDDYLKQTALVRTKCRELQENADIVMDEMIKRHMSPHKTNTELVGKKGGAYSRDCVYWLPDLIKDIEESLLQKRSLKSLIRMYELSSVLIIDE